MPLKDALPVIDDRTYDDILAEIRTRIPRYTPEWKPQWSDLNDSDPGMILAQTFAWLSELLLYRMQRVPELHYLKFLELIGIELQPAQPARADVTFAVSESATTPTVAVPALTQVSAASDEGEPVVFETERSLTAVACTLQAVQAYDGAAYEDVTTLNAQPSASDSGFHPFGEDPREDGALVLGFGFGERYPTPDAFPAISLDLAFFAADAAGGGRTLQCGERAYASATLQWEGFDGTLWQKLDLLSDDTLAFTRTGHVVVRVPSNVSLQRAYLGEYDGIDPVTEQPRDTLFWLRARLVRTQYERAPRLAAIRTNTVSAIQAQTVRGEILGGTSGARNQTFQLQNTPVIRGSVRIQIDEGRDGDPRDWTIVDDLFGSRPADEHLAVNWSSGEVRAGDGERGQIPVANAANPDTNVVAAEYRYGGGTKGNVRAGEIASILTSVDGIDEVSNLFDASGGREEEELSDAQARARLTLRARERAVAVEDFELLAQQAGNVKRAKALPLVHPQFPGIKVPGAVTVIVVPDSEAPNPQPSDGLLRTVCEYLDARRLLTTELFIVGPRYLLVSVEAQVIVADTADTSQVKQDVEAILSAYLHPLTGGDAGTGWPFGATLRYSKIVHRVFTVAGVESVPSLVLLVDGERQPECRDVPITANALVYTTTHAITVMTEREAGDAA